ERDWADAPLNRSRFLAQLQGLFPALAPETVATRSDWREAFHITELVAPLIKARRSAGRDARTASRKSRNPDPGPFNSGWETLAALPAFDSLREQLRALAAYEPGETLSPTLAGQLYGPVLRASVSALEQFAA